MTEKIVDFPKKDKKDEVHLLVPESDFNTIMRCLTKEYFKSGRTNGFFIGFAAANVINVIIQYFSHAGMGN